METFWGWKNVEWGGALTNLREGPLLFDKEVLLERIEVGLATKLMPLCMSSLEWKAWEWLGILSFKKASTKLCTRFEV